MTGMYRFDFSLKVLVLGDHKTGKTAVLQKFRRQNMARYRGRRHSLPTQSFVTVEIELIRHEKHVLLKALDTGGEALTLVYCFLDQNKLFTSKQRLINVDATSLRRIDVDTTLFKRFGVYWDFNVEKL